MNSLAEENLRAARVRLQHERPYFSAALWAVRFEESKDCPTMGVSKGWTCYFNPDAVAKWPIPSIVTVLQHELWHLLRAHHERAQAQGISQVNLAPWNIATDAEINDGLVEQQQPFPPGIEPILPATLKQPPHLLAEEYYNRMPKQPMSVPQFGGSCADGVARAYEKDGDGSGKDGKENKAGKGAASASGPRVIPAELIRKQVAEEIGKFAGTLPGDVRRWAGKQLAPKVIPWQTILRSVLGRMLAAGKREEYTFARPTRREFPGYIFPGQTGTIPEIVACVDTSGSMTDGCLAESLSIIESVLEYLGRIAPITVIAGDTIPQSTQKVCASAAVKLEGGGGTDMGALIAHAVTMHPKPQVIVVITDGYTPWPASAPKGMQTVVVLVSDGTSPKWATTVRVPAREKED